MRVDETIEDVLLLIGAAGLKVNNLFQLSPPLELRGKCWQANLRSDDDVKCFGWAQAETPILALRLALAEARKEIKDTPEVDPFA